VSWRHGMKASCGVEFGLGDYGPSLFGIADRGPGHPHPDGTGITVPTVGWPGPNEGVIITADTPWSGNYLPVYQFRGYAYGYGPPGVIPLSPHPVTGFAGTLDTLEPPGQHSAVCLGGLGVNTPGIDCEPLPPSAMEELPPPRAVQLLPCHPNPFTGVTLISYELPADHALPVRLRVFDATGRLVRDLMDKVVPGGRYLAYWDGTNDQCRPESTGVYYVQLTTGDVTQRMGVILAR
jgi:hypothetical protein